MLEYMWVGSGVQYHIKSHVTHPRRFPVEVKAPVPMLGAGRSTPILQPAKALRGTIGDVLCQILSWWFLEMISPTKWAAKKFPIHDELGNFRVWHMICYTSSLEANQPLSRTYFCANWYDIFIDIDKNIACVVAPVYIDTDCTYIWHFKV